MRYEIKSCEGRSEVSAQLPERWSDYERKVKKIYADFSYDLVQFK